MFNYLHGRLISSRLCVLTCLQAIARTDRAADIGNLGCELRRGDSRVYGQSTYIGAPYVPLIGPIGFVLSGDRQRQDGLGAIGQERSRLGGPVDLGGAVKPGQISAGT